MLARFPLDIVVYITNYLDNISDLFILISTNYDLYKMIDDSYFNLWAVKHFGEKFWNLANKRTKSISLPLQSMKLELIRIGKFQIMLKNNNIRWSNQDYYNYWQTLENIRINQKVITANLQFRI